MTSWSMVYSRRTRMVHDVMDVILSEAEVVKGVAHLKVDFTKDSK